MSGVHFITDSTNPEQNGTYLVLYVPYGEFHNKSWQFAFYSADDAKWHIYLDSAVSNYMLTHWCELPLLPSKPNPNGWEYDANNREY